MIVMDGLSAAASGIAVVSLAFQCADGLLKLHDFMKSIKDAPEEISLICNDLRLPAEIIAALHCEEEAYRDVLELLQAKTTRLQLIITELEVDFRSVRKRDKYWTAFIAAKSGVVIRRFRDSLVDTKSTLMLGLKQDIRLSKHNLHFNRLHEFRDGAARRGGPLMRTSTSLR